MNFLAQTEERANRDSLRPKQPVASNTPYPALFSELTLGSRRLRNRIAFASVFSGLARNGEVTPELINFHVSRAKGGAAMIVAEAFAMWRIGAPLAQARVHGQDNLDRFSHWAAAVADEGTILLGQITEQGRGDMRPARKIHAVSASSLADDMSWTMPHAMTVGEIREMISDMVASTARLQACGFAGIEISGGHGHIFHQFMSPWMNRREDEFGGSLENRMRLLDELVVALRRECGSEFLIGARLPGNDGLPASIDWEVAAEIAAWATRDRALDYVNFVQGAHAWTLHQHLPDMHGERGPYIEPTAKLRQFSNGVAVGVTGRILEPVQAETLLADGKADFVMLGRTLIADPAWGLKSSQNRDNDIRKCVSCNNCWGESVAGRGTVCDNNPRVGLKEETDWWPSKAPYQKRVVVVGGGVAGLEAAWIAGARGHHVTLFSESAEPGGRIRLYSQLPGCEAVSSIFDYQLAMAQKCGVRFELSHRADAQDVRNCNPDAVILATGGSMQWPEQLPVELRDEGFILDLHTISRDLVQRRSRQGGTAVLYDFDGMDMTYSAAEMLADVFDRVVIINPVESIARDEASVKRQSIYHRIMQKGIEVIPWSEPSSDSRFEDGVFVYRNVMTRRQTEIEDVQLFTYATPRTPRNGLRSQIAEFCADVRLVGDAYVARSTIMAMQDGHRAGCEV